MKPYVGITGPSTVNEARAVLDEFTRAGYSMQTSHAPMIGILASYKTLNHQSTQNRRYPKIDTIKNIFSGIKGKAFSMIHYNTKEQDSLPIQIINLFDELYNDGYCRALQLNVVWPKTLHLALIKTDYPQLEIVLQLSHKATANLTNKEIANKVQSYGPTISYVLIDPSGGRGLEFDLENSVSLYAEIKERLPDITIGFAGGLLGENVAKRVNAIIDKIGKNDFCIDAEGGLRDKLSEEYGDDVLNLKKVQSYLKEAAIILK